MARYHTKDRFVNVWSRHQDSRISRFRQRQFQSSPLFVGMDLEGRFEGEEFAEQTQEGVQVRRGGPINPIMLT